MASKKYGVDVMCRDKHVRKDVKGRGFWKRVRFACRKLLRREDECSI